jgi:predicted Zn-dependent protease with MMP-like domain
MNGTASERLEDFLVGLETQRGTDPEAALRELEDAPADLRNRPEVRLFAADLTWETRGADAARPPLERLVGEIPDYADARHLLGVVCDELGDERAKIEQFLEVRRLDEGLDDTIDRDQARELEDMMVDTAEQTIQNLPEPFRQRLSNVPILIEPRPSEALVREGLDPRALGLFEGPTHLDHLNSEISELPTRIVLYSLNLLADVVDEDQLRAEVETTVLHELGHYLGLDEDDLERLGLD